MIVLSFVDGATVIDVVVVDVVTEVPSLISVSDLTKSSFTVLTGSSVFFEALFPQE